MIVTVCTDLRTGQEFVVVQESRRHHDACGSRIVAFGCEIITIYVGF